MDGHVKKALFVIKIDIDAAGAVVDLVEDIHQRFLDAAHAEIRLKDRNLFHARFRLSCTWKIAYFKLYNTFPAFARGEWGWIRDFAIKMILQF